MIKNLQRRREEIATTPGAFDKSGDVEASDSLFIDEFIDGAQGSPSAISNNSTTDLNSPQDFGDTLYSADPLDDDFGRFLHESLMPQNLSSSDANTANLTGGTVSNGRSASVSDPCCTMLTPASVVRTHPCNNTNRSSANTHIPNGVEASLAFQHFPEVD